MSDAAKPRLPVVVLISGRGINLQAIMEAVERGSLPIEIRAVISNRPNAGGLEHAALAGDALLDLDEDTSLQGPTLQRFETAPQV